MDQWLMGMDEHYKVVDEGETVYSRSHIWKRYELDDEYEFPTISGLNTIRTRHVHALYVSDAFDTSDNETMLFAYDGTSWILLRRRWDMVTDDSGIRMLLASSMGV